MKVVYEGPSPAVHIAGGYYAERGIPVEVPDDLAKSLLEQEIFEPAKKSKPADPAASDTAQEG